MSPSSLLEENEVVEQQPTTSRGGGGGSYDSQMSRMFTRYDVHETSYHFYSNQLTFHICDDAGGK